MPGIRGEFQKGVIARLRADTSLKAEPGWRCLGPRKLLLRFSARVGLIDRSNLGSIDFGVVGPTRAKRPPNAK
jgi:hypothetical protein